MPAFGVSSSRQEEMEAQKQAKDEYLDDDIAEEIVGEEGHVRPIDSDTEEEDHLRSDDEAPTDRKKGATIRDKLLCPSTMIPTCAGFATPSNAQEDTYSLAQT